MDELEIADYLNAKGITIIGQYFNYDKNIHKGNIIPQIDLIVELHKALIGCKFNELNRIKSTIGREVEAYKVQIRKLQRHYDYIFNKSCTNEIENLILSDGKAMLKQGESAIKYIYEHNYFEIIKRSMNREEICLGKVDRNNLKKNNGKIEIGTIKSMSYNLVEEDLYNYIKRLQRKEVYVDEEELIKVFVYGAHLSFSSIEYLRGLISYPKDFLRVWERYRDSQKQHINGIYNLLNERNLECKNDKKDKDEKEVLSQLKKSLEYESKSFIV